MHKRRFILLLGILLALLAYFPVFQFLGKQPYRLWDESRQAFNAYEMYNNHKYLVTYFEDQPDMWNTKPPLLIWLQVVSMKIFGVGEFALRFPSAVAGFLACMILYYFCARFLKKPLLGFCAGLVLVSFNGFVEYHVTRTGDYDALLTLFDLVALLSFFVYLDKKSTSALYFTFAGLILASLTKGIAGLMFVPAMLFAVLYFKSLKDLLTNKHFYIGICSFVLFVGGYYYAREIVNPGYLKAVAENELGGRFLSTIEQHRHDFIYYFENMRDWQLGYWLLLIPAGILTSWFSPKSRERNFLLFATFSALIFLFIISISKTKLVWYNVPSFPLFALTIAAFLVYICDLLRGIENTSILRKSVLPAVFIFIVALPAYKGIVNKTYQEKEFDWNQEEFRIGYYLRDLLKGKEEVKEPLFVLFDGYPYQLTIYNRMLKDRGITSRWIKDEDLHSGMLVVLSQNAVDERLRKNNQVELLRQIDVLRLYRIK